MKTPRPRVVALDLEGVLISNAVSQFPRPHLYAFLEECRALFDRVVMFTTVREPVFRDIARTLVSEGNAPAWFADVEFTEWHGKHKDLAFVKGIDPSLVVLVDDMEAYVLPEQKSQWVPVKGFEPFTSEDDDELLVLLKTLKETVGGSS